MATGTVADGAGVGPGRRGGIASNRGLCAEHAAGLRCRTHRG